MSAQQVIPDEMRPFIRKAIENAECILENAKNAYNTKRDVDIALYLGRIIPDLEIARNSILEAVCLSVKGKQEED